MAMWIGVLLAWLECMMKDVPAQPKKHHCPVCFRCIHAICGVMNPSNDSILFSQICPPCNDTNKQVMEGIEQLTQRQDDAPVARRKQVSSMRKTTTGSKGKGGGRNRKPKVLSKDGVVKTVTGASFLQKRVAFAWSESSPTPIQEAILKAYKVASLPDEAFHKDDVGRKYLIGVVLNEQVGKKEGRDWWQVEFQHTAMPSMKFQSSIALVAAITEYQQILSRLLGQHPLASIH
jgi:hypothetical protein